MTSSTLEQTTIVLTTEQLNLAVERHTKDRKRFDALLAALDKPRDVNLTIEYRRCKDSFDSADASLRRVCENDPEVIAVAISKAYKMDRPFTPII